MPNIEIPIQLEIKGEVYIEKKDVRTGEIVETRKGHNMLLNNYLDGLLSNQDCHFQYGFSSCAIGNDDTPPSRSDNGCVSQLASVSGSKNSSSSLGEMPVFAQYKFEFPAETGTGTIKEVSAGSSARKVLSTPIEKNDYHELIVYWKISINGETQQFSGTISGGQRDGTTDINWISTINNEQIYRMFNFTDFNPFDRTLGFSNLDSDVILGDSNSPSDLINDSDSNIKGNILYNDVPDFNSVYSYTSETYQRKRRIGFEKTNANGSIGELLITGCGNYSYGIFRITFDPKLDKIDTYRLYFDFIISLVNPS